MTLVARQREHFRFFLAIFLVGQLSPKRGFLVHKNSLASCQRRCHGVEPHALTCPFKHSDLIAWSLWSWHPTHKYLWGRLYFVQACRLLFTVTVTQAETRIMSMEALVSKTVSVKISRSAWALGSRGTKQLETVVTRVIAATGSFYFARGIGSQASVGAAVHEGRWAGKTHQKNGGKMVEMWILFRSINSVARGLGGPWTWWIGSAPVQMSGCCLGVALSWLRDRLACGGWLFFIDPSFLVSRGNRTNNLNTVFVLRSWFFFHIYQGCCLEKPVSLTEHPVVWRFDYAVCVSTLHSCLQHLQ